MSKAGKILFITEMLLRLQAQAGARPPLGLA
jgi:hypothetical protein